MRKIILVSIIFILTLNSTFAKDPKYPVSEIDQALINNAKAIVRNHSTKFIVQSAGDGKMEITYAITIMNKSGIRYSFFAELYNKFFKIRNVKGTFYDEFGEQIKKLKKEDLIDVPAIAGYSLYEDNRAILYDPDIKDFPFTVEYSYTVDFDGFINYPDWNLYTDYNVSIQHKKLQLEIPKNMKVRSYCQNFNYKPIIGKDNEKTIYFWEANELPALQEEPYSLALLNASEVLYLAPEEFKIGGSKGNMKSWSAFGDWIYSLNKDRDIIPDETKAKIFELVKDAQTDIEKVKILYKYMQDKTRYVNISVGLGGWQPFEAEVVDRLSYGDCKALSNYMQSLLNIVGIESIYTLVRAGKDAPFILSDFPMNQFNHAILCVPMEDDTLWLECTNPKIPAGYIGKFTDDRDVLLIKDNESKLTHTKVYRKEENALKRKIEFSINENGGGQASVLSTYTGLKTDEVYHITDATDKDKKSNLYENIKIPDFTVEEYNFKIREDIIPEIDEEVTLTINKYGTIMGDRLIVPVNLMNRIDDLPKKVKNRNNNVIIRRSSIEVDSISYLIPDGYNFENVPDNLTINSQFGEYKAVIQIMNNVLSYKRTLTFDKGEYPANSYELLRDFMISISKADNGKFVLVKSN
ncbi:MAG: DUF3857 domain-containing protein [Bacteroidales bacterium]|nr:DUF3857 domain-containing protein [Bacteroidales bacterium]